MILKEEQCSSLTYVQCAMNNLKQSIDYDGFGLTCQGHCIKNLISFHCTFYLGSLKWKIQWQMKTV